MPRALTGAIRLVATAEMLPTDTTLIADLVRAGVTDPDLLQRVSDMMRHAIVMSASYDASLSRRRGQAAETAKKYRLRKKSSYDASLSHGLIENPAPTRESPAPERVSGSSSKVVDTGKKIQKERTSSRQKRDDAFDDFWKTYPHKVGKRDAEKAWAGAVSRSPTEEIISGVSRYIEAKPPDRPWCNPSTFLNQDRWTDQPAQGGSSAPEKLFARAEYIPPTEEEIANETKREAVSGA